MHTEKGFERRVYYSQFSQPHGEAPRLVRQQKEQGGKKGTTGKYTQEPSITVFKKRNEQAGYAAETGLGRESWKNFGGCWSIGVVPRLALG